MNDGIQLLRDLADTLADAIEEEAKLVKSLEDENERLKKSRDALKAEVERLRAATRKALGEAGKKEPEPCVWTVNVTENSWILGCDESKDTSAPPKVCPYCKKRVEVRG